MRERAAPVSGTGGDVAFAAAEWGNGSARGFLRPRYGKNRAGSPRLHLVRAAPAEFRTPPGNGIRRSGDAAGHLFCDLRMVRADGRVLRCDLHGRATSDARGRPGPATAKAA